MGNIGMCRCEGYGFQAVYCFLEHSYSRIGRIWGVYSGIGYQNSAELALV